MEALRGRQVGAVCVFVCVDVFLVRTKNAFVPIERVYSVNTFLLISLSHQGVSAEREPACQRSVNGASEQRA